MLFSYSSNQTLRVPLFRFCGTGILVRHWYFREAPQPGT